MHLTRLPLCRAGQQAVDVLPPAFWEACINRLLKTGHSLQPSNTGAAAALYRRALPDAALQTASFAWGRFEQGRGRRLVLRPPELASGITWQRDARVRLRCA